MNQIVCLLVALSLLACEGPAGPMGPEGPQGPQGSQGEKGERGDPGRQGAMGQTGARGEKGDRGDQGPQGTTGAEGPQGDVGPQGEKGDRGEPGFSGVAAFSFVEATLGSKYWESDRGRYVIEDERVRPETVIEVYLKFFYSDTGTPYYIPFDTAIELDHPYYEIFYTVDDHTGGRIVVYDSSQQLAGENLAVMVTGTDEMDGT